MTVNNLPRYALDMGVPDSAVATQALAIVTEASPGFLLNHALRVFAFGGLLCRKYGRAFDPELAFVAAVMHDLGFTDQYASTHQRFELDGADAARGFLIQHQVAADQAELVWDAIALHTAFGIAERKAPEVALVHFGINMDVGGVGADLLSASEINEVLAQHPRLGFQDHFRKLVTEHANRRPHCHRYTWAGWVARDYIANPEAPAAQTLHSQHWDE